VITFPYLRHSGIERLSIRFPAIVKTAVFENPKTI
jgi:hypothetical protein